MHGVWQCVWLGSTNISCSERRSSEEDRAEGSPEVSPKERENIFIPRSTLGQSLSL